MSRRYDWSRFRRYLEPGAVANEIDPDDEPTVRIPVERGEDLMRNRISGQGGPGFFIADTKACSGCGATVTLRCLDSAGRCRACQRPSSRSAAELERELRQHAEAGS